MYSTKLKKAYEQRDKKLHDTLVEFDSCPEILLEQLCQRSSMIAADLVEQMRFERLRITEAIFDIAYITDINKMCPLAQVITKAKAYVAMRNLAREELIDKEEAHTLMAAVKLTSNEIAQLKRNDIDHLKLNFK